MARYGYARVSTTDQHPEAQAERLRAAGCELVFTDKGISGTHASRPKWDKLLARLQPGDVLVATKLDRIGRSVRNLLDVAALLQDRGIDLICLDQPIDTTSPQGKLFFTILAAFAEFERNLIIERTRDGQASVRRAGNLRRSLGGPPVLGFRDDGGDDWQLDQAAADWLSEAAVRVLAGEPVEAVHAALPEIRDAAGRLVTAKMLRAALQRPASAGLITDNGGYLPAGTGGPLDETTWRRLRTLFGSRKLGRPVEAGRYPMGPLLRCAKCGNQLTGELVRPRNGGPAVPYYACANPHKALGVTRPCKGVSVPAEDVHVLLRQAVMIWAETPVAKLAAARVPETASRRAELEASIAEEQDWLGNLMEKRGRRGITPAKYAELEAETMTRIEDAAAELAELERIDAQPGVPVVIDWESLTAAEQIRTLTEAYQTPIVVQPGNGGKAALSAADRIELIPRS